MTPLEFKLIREIASHPEGQEGYTLGRLFIDGDSEPLCYTLEDQDRYLEDGNGKIYGRSAIPTGRYRLEIYNSPKHGIVPLFKNVPGFEYIEMHKANHAEELLGCIAVGEERTEDGVRKCAPALRLIVAEMIRAKMEDRVVYCTVARA